MIIERAYPLMVTPLMVHNAIAGFGSASTTQVMANAQMFAFPVPALAGGGEPLVRAENSPLSDSPTWPKAKTGLVYSVGAFAEKSQLMPKIGAARGDGSDAIVMNNVTSRQAGILLEAYSALGKPEAMPIESIKVFLKIAEQNGVREMWTIERSRLKEQTRPVFADRLSFRAYDASFGYLKFNSADHSTALFLRGPFRFQSTQQKPQMFESGGVLLVKASREVNCASCEEFESAYGRPDGSAITALELAPHALIDVENYHMRFGGMMSSWMLSHFGLGPAVRIYTKKDSDKHYDELNNIFVGSF